MESLEAVSGREEISEAGDGEIGGEVGAEARM